MSHERVHLDPETLLFSEGKLTQLVERLLESSAFPAIKKIRFHFCFSLKMNALQCGNVGTHECAVAGMVNHKL
jgi:hypothetical protein